MVHKYSSRSFSYFSLFVIILVVNVSFSSAFWPFTGKALDLGDLKVPTAEPACSDTDGPGFIVQVNQIIHPALAGDERSVHLGIISRGKGEGVLNASIVGGEEGITFSMDGREHTIRLRTTSSTMKATIEVDGMIKDVTEGSTYIFSSPADSQGQSWNNPFLRGIVRYKSYFGANRVIGDTCDAEESTLLKEYYCKNGRVQSEQVTCENGCIEGACVSQEMLDCTTCPALYQKCASSAQVRYQEHLNLCNQDYEFNCCRDCIFAGTSYCTTGKQNCLADGEKDYKNATSDCTKAYRLLCPDPFASL